MAAPSGGAPGHGGVDAAGLCRCGDQGLDEGAGLVGLARRRGTGDRQPAGDEAEQQQATGGQQAGPGPARWGEFVSHRDPATLPAAHQPPG